MVEAEDEDALLALTPAQRGALERARLARTMAEFNADTFEARLRTERQREADLRNEREADLSDAKRQATAAERRAAFKVVKGAEQ